MKLEEIIKAVRRPILDKEMGSLFYAIGAFGNHSRQWESYAALVASDYRGRVAIRYRQPGRNHMRYGLAFEEVPAVMKEFVEQGADPTLFYFTEMVTGTLPFLRATFQGEVRYDAGEWYLLYSLTNATMREALATAGEECCGWRARELCRHYMDPSSFADLLSIQDMWPDHVVEFSCFNRAVGILNSRFCRNTIFWEVRYH
jgi:hypothetical protein